MSSLLNKAFVDLTNLLRLEISHAHVVTFEEQLHSADIVPYNRIYIVKKESIENESWIINHSVSPSQKIKLEKGFIYFIPLDQKLEYNFQKGLYMIAYHFTLEIFPGFDIFSSEKLILKSIFSKEVLQLIETHCRETQSLESIATVHGAILMIAASFCKFTAEDIKVLSSITEGFKPVVDYLEKCVSAQTDLTILANLIGENREQLSKRFARKTGIPLKKYMMKILLRKASQLLLMSDLKIIEISEKLEFSSEHYFTRFFKKNTGVSPSQFRLNNRIE